jgi:aryl-alcohol dehydrogenase-like predicted oxidoreductase
MEYRLLGSSGCAVSALALGTLTFGNETDQATSFSQLDRFTEAGGPWWTALAGRAAGQT